MGNDTRKRNRQFTIFLLDEELEILNAKADEAEMSKSEYMRNMILFGAAHKRSLMSEETERALVYEVNKIGTNLNQIAARANSSRIVDDRDFDNLYHNYLELLTVFDKFARGKSYGDY